MAILYVVGISRILGPGFVRRFSGVLYTVRAQLCADGQDLAPVSSEMYVWSS